MERMLAFDVLPSLVSSTEDERLRAAFEEHLGETRAQSERAEGVFRALGLDPSSNRSAPLETLAKSHDELAGKIVLPALRDAFHAAAAVATERWELTLYEAAIDLANAMRLDGEAVGLLEQSRAEEHHALLVAEAERRRLLDSV
ncbi:MAG: DUF892 family protein [Actinobacteria bacterium]|nr:DUF892 family protein [Actinomycetota bacterium]